MVRYLLAILLAALVAVGLWGKTASNRAVAATNLAGEYQRSLESLERAVAAQAKSEKAARESLEKRAKVAEQLAAKTKKENRDLKEALAASPDWAGQPIPDRVRESINH